MPYGKLCVGRNLKQISKGKDWTQSNSVWETAAFWLETAATNIDFWGRHQFSVGAAAVHLPTAPYNGGNCVLQKSALSTNGANLVNK